MEMRTAPETRAPRTASRVRHSTPQYKFTIEILKGAKYCNPIRQVSKTLNIACRVDR